jgi:hypothetical protein
VRARGVGPWGWPALLEHVEPTPETAGGFRKGCGKIQPAPRSAGTAPATGQPPTRTEPGAGRGLGHRGAARPTRACANLSPSLVANGDGRRALARVVGVFSQHRASGHLQRIQSGNVGFRSDVDNPPVGFVAHRESRPGRQCARIEAELVVGRWNRRLASGRDMLWSPTIRAALLAGAPRLDVFCRAVGLAGRSICARSTGILSHPSARWYLAYGARGVRDQHRCRSCLGCTRCRR